LNIICLRLLQSQQSTGDKRSYDINSNSTSKEITQENQVDNDGNRNGTIKKRKSEVDLFLLRILFHFVFVLF